MGELVKARVTKGGWSWNGRTAHVGDTLEASEKQVSVWETAGYVERVGAKAPAPPGPDAGETGEPGPAQEPTEDAPGDPVAEPEDGREWPHKITPEQYLNRFPDGPDADLARAVLGQTEE